MKRVRSAGERLGWRERIGFGAGDFAQNLVYPAAGMYLLFFYTDILGLSPGIAAAMFLAVQILDMFWNPLAGALMDRWSPRWGKYRSHLLLAGVPFSLMAVLCFFNPFGAGAGLCKTVYAFATFASFSMLFTVLNVSYGALGSSLTRDTDEIAVLTTARIFLANAGGFAAAAGVPLLVAALAGERDLPWRMALFMGLGMLPSFIFMPMIPALRRRLGKKNLFFAFSPAALLGMAALYAASRFGRVEDHPVLVYAAQFVKASGIMLATGCMWAFVPDVITYSERMAGRRLSGIVTAIIGVFFRIGLAMGRIVPAIVLGVAGYEAAAAEEPSSLPSDPRAWLLAISILAAIAIAALSASFAWTKERLAMDAKDSGDVGLCDLVREFVRNRPLRILSLFFVCAFAMMSIGNAAGAYFMNGLEAQSPAAQEAIRWLVSVIPAALAVVSAAVLRLYPLTDGKIDEIGRDIESAGRDRKPATPRS